MAGTKNPTEKKTTVKKSNVENLKNEDAEKVVVEKNSETTQNNAELENKFLKEQMLKMQAQIDTMTKMFATLSTQKEIQKQQEEKNSNRLIKFINLKDATIVLKGTSFWTIEGRYNYREFPEKEARVIALNMSSYLRSGSVYIDDAQFVKDNDLDTVYETLLSDTDLKNLLNHSATDVIETYKNVNENQKEIIIDMIVADKKAGKIIDNNILVELGKLSNRNLLEPED